MLTGRSWATMGCFQHVRNKYAERFFAVGIIWCTDWVRATDAIAIPTVCLVACADMRGDTASTPHRDASIATGLSAAPHYLDHSWFQKRLTDCEDLQYIACTGWTCEMMEVWLVYWLAIAT